MNKSEILKSLIKFNQNIDLIADNLSKFDWDSEPQFFLTTEDIYNVLKRHLEGSVSIEDIEKWANLIEMRDDIVLEEGREELLKEIIFYLANSEINYNLTKNFIEKLKHRLGKLN